MSNETHARTGSTAQRRHERQRAAARILALLSEARLDGRALDRIRRLDPDDTDFAPAFVEAVRGALAAPRRRGRRCRSRPDPKS